MRSSTSIFRRRLRACSRSGAGGAISRALDKIAALLRPRGRLIVNEHAVERLDEPTARWYLDKRTQARPDTSQSLERCLREWSDDHADLHGYAAMRRELDRRFTERFFTWRPYLYGELGGVASEAEEQALIDAGAIHSLRRRDTSQRTDLAVSADLLARA